MRRRGRCPDDDGDTRPPSAGIDRGAGPRAPEQRARRRLGSARPAFSCRWQTGVYGDPDDDPEALTLAVPLPIVGVAPWRDGRDTEGARCRCRVPRDQHRCRAAADRGAQGGTVARVRAPGAGRRGAVAPGAAEGAGDVRTPAAVGVRSPQLASAGASPPSPATGMCSQLARRHAGGVARHYGCITSRIRGQCVAHPRAAAGDPRSRPSPGPNYVGVTRTRPCGRRWAGGVVTTARDVENHGPLETAMAGRFHPGSNGNRRILGLALWRSTCPRRRWTASPLTATATRPATGERRGAAAVTGRADHQRDRRSSSKAHPLRTSATTLVQQSPIWVPSRHGSTVARHGRSFREARCGSAGAHRHPRTRDPCRLASSARPRIRTALSTAPRVFVVLLPRVRTRTSACVANEDKRGRMRTTSGGRPFVHRRADHDRHRRTGDFSSPVWKRKSRPHAAPAARPAPRPPLGLSGLFRLPCGTRNRTGNGRG